MVESWTHRLDLSSIDWNLNSLLFLDFDGVLHAENDFNALQFDRMPLLERALEAHPGVGVVLTTSWRMDRSFEQLRAPFGARLRYRVVGCTPLLPEGMGDGGRWDEIQKFLETNFLLGIDFAILDDQARLFPDPCESLILVEEGMTYIDARRLDMKLSEWQSN